MTTAHPDMLHRPPRMPSDKGAQRTVMAADRTLMAWIRTALSMISFGFTIYKVMEAVAKQVPLAHPNTPRQVGLFLIALGTASMVFGTASYLATMADLKKDEPFRISRPVLWVGVILSVGGASLFITIIRRLA